MGLKCQIHLERPEDGAYRPGSTIVGYVRYSVNRDTQFDSIMLSLRGKSECMWKEKSRNDSYSRIKFSACEEIITIHSNLMTSPIGIVPAGEHTASFRFVLPQNIPSTLKYHNDYGNATVSYYISMKFTHCGIFNFPQKFRTDITVINMIEPSIPQEPLTYGLQDSLVRKFGYVGGQVDVDLQVTISKPFVIPGENVDLRLQVINNTKYKIPKLKIGLFQTITLTDDVGRTKIFSKEIKEARTKTEKPKKSHETCLYSSITIPSDLSTMRDSKIISRDYKITVIMSVPDLKRETNLDIPLLIGQVAPRPTELPNEEPLLELPTNPGPPIGFESTSNLVVHNNNYVVNQNHVVVNPRASNVPEAPPAYWEVMTEDKQVLQDFKI